MSVFLSSALLAPMVNNAELVLSSWKIVSSHPSGILFPYFGFLYTAAPVAQGLLDSEAKFSSGWDDSSSLRPVTFCRKSYSIFLIKDKVDRRFIGGHANNVSSLLGKPIGIPTASSLTAFSILQKASATFIFRKMWKSPNCSTQP